jgi:cold shock CspA family protein
VGEHTRGAVRKTAPRQVAPGRAAERRGTPSSGRIITLFIGQGHGFIRLANGREVFFHRSDMREGASFNEFAVGDAVKFELLEDDVSGPRALHVERRRPRR